MTTLVENKKAQLVVIAHDVDPIEVRLWLRVAVPKRSRSVFRGESRPLCPVAYLQCNFFVLLGKSGIWLALLLYPSVQGRCK